MAVRDPKDVFLTLLSDVRQNTERAAKVYQEMGQMAQDPEIKEALEARAFVSQKTLEKLDQCFKLVGEQPVKLTGRLRLTLQATMELACSWKAVSRTRWLLWSGTVA